MRTRRLHFPPLPVPPPPVDDPRLRKLPTPLRPSSEPKAKTLSPALLPPNLAWAALREDAGWPEEDAALRMVEPRAG